MEIRDSEDHLLKLAETFLTTNETKGAIDVLKWSYQFFEEDSIVYASSFGAEAMVLIDLISAIKQDAHIIFLDTGLHFPETYDVIDAIEARFPN